MDLVVNTIRTDSSDLGRLRHSKSAEYIPFAHLDLHRRLSLTVLSRWGAGFFGPAAISAEVDCVIQPSCNQVGRTRSVCTKTSLSSLRPGCRVRCALQGASAQLFLPGNGRKLDRSGSSTPGHTRERISLRKVRTTTETSRGQEPVFPKPSPPSTSKAEESCFPALQTVLPVSVVLQLCSFCLFVVKLGFNLNLVLQGPSARFWCSSAMAVSRCAACFLDAAVQRRVIVLSLIFR